jgi:serine/tyrosine/threonine adenylyltransferase
MIASPQDAPYVPERTIDEISDFLVDPVKAADFPKAILRFRNDKAAREIGLSHLSDAQWIAHFGRFTALPGSLAQPLALRYHGHQFRNYNPDLGDGRGFLFAQLRDEKGRLLDLGTKGSGQTPYSRFGDGRLTLKGAVREILATEMLEALGVETSRSFSVIETGEALHRGDEPSPTRSAVLVRLNHGHLRIGSFQRLATLGEVKALERLTRYALKHYFNTPETEQPAEDLLAMVTPRAARMAASFMAAGFVHGVLNSDNINITGESFDYGPWRWAPSFDPAFTAAYFDESGLYAYGRQAEAIHWDVAQLAIALTSLVDQEALIPVLDGFRAHYHTAVIEKMLNRLNLKPLEHTENAGLIAALELALHQSQVPLDAFYFDFAGGRAKNAVRYADPLFDDFKAKLAAFKPANSMEHAYWRAEKPCSLLLDEVEAIWAPIAENDDWSLLAAKITAIRAMGEAYL